MLKNQQSFTEMQTTYFQHINHKIKNECVHFTFMHLADAFIQSDLQCIQAIHFFLSVCVHIVNEFNEFDYTSLTAFQCMHLSSKLN